MEAIRQTWIHSNDPENRSRENLRVTAIVYHLTERRFPQNIIANQEYCQNFKYLVMNHVCRRVPTQEKTSKEKTRTCIHISSKIRIFDQSTRAVEDREAMSSAYITFTLKLSAKLKEENSH